MKTYSYPSHKGVTLLEMLIVVTIIGILATIAIPNFTAMVQNYRTRSGVMTLLNTIRKERARALSLSRELEMVITKSTKTYTVEKLAYTLYDPASPGVALFNEAAEFLVPSPGNSYDPRDGIDDATINSNAATTTLTLVFYPSGMIETDSGGADTLFLQGRYMDFTITIYKAGQVILEGIGR